MASDRLRKVLDARGRRALAREQLPRKVEVMVRTERQLSEEQKAALEGAGYETHFATGNVVTGRVETARLEQVAELPFVRRIEVSRPLYEEASAASDPQADSGGPKDVEARSSLPKPDPSQP